MKPRLDAKVAKCVAKWRKLIKSLESVFLERKKERKDEKLAELAAALHQPLAAEEDLPVEVN